jgi:hypothetical protein
MRFVHSQIIESCIQALPDSDMDETMLISLEALDDSLHDAQAEILRLQPKVAHWVREYPRDEMPPIDVPVRVVWHDRGKSDPKRAVWTGEYWATVQRRGHYGCSPDWWLYEPPLPEPPTSR